jgi:hypothetical protein
MKKKFIFLLVFALIEIVLLFVSIFMDPIVRLILVGIIIVLPFALPIAYFLYLLHPSLGLKMFGASDPNSPVDVHKPLIQNRSAFLKAQPYFCTECKKFTDIMREYCEFCGTQNSLRKATKQDFNDYIKSERQKG